MRNNDVTGPRKIILKHRIRWVEETFRSRAVTEELLAPELESGNLTTNDYEHAVKFLPRARLLRHEAAANVIIFGGLSAFAIQRSRPRWSGLQKTSVIGSLAFLGWSMGRMYQLVVHHEYVGSLENPEGYGKAIQNVEKRIGISNDKFPGPMITLDKNVEDTEDKYPNGTIMLPSLSSEDFNKPQVQVAPQQSTVTKWDEIRKANNRVANNSSWDDLRQKHERANAKSQSNSDSSNQAGETSEPADLDRYADSSDKYSKTFNSHSE